MRNKTKSYYVCTENDKQKMYIFICQISDLARLFIVKMEELVISNKTWQFVFVGLALLELPVKAVRHYLYFISCVFYFSGEEDRRESGVGFHVHKDIVCALLECRPVSNRLISSLLRAATFNIPSYRFMHKHLDLYDSEVDHYYQQLQETIYQTPENDILLVQGDWNAKAEKDAQADWRIVFGPYCNVETNERELRLLEFATFNSQVLKKHPWSSQTIQKMDMAQPRWETHNQIDYNLVRKRFRSGVNIPRARSFPGADIGSDHDLVMMTFRVRLTKARKLNQPGIRLILRG